MLCIASWTLPLGLCLPRVPPSPASSWGRGTESGGQLRLPPQGLGPEMAPCTSPHLSGQNSATLLQLTAREPGKCHRAVFQEDFDRQLTIPATCLKINKIREIKYIRCL